MNVRTAIRTAATRLCDAGITEYENDAWLLFSELTGMSRSDYLIGSNEELDLDTIAKYNAMIDRRAQREPLQYITGKAYFMGFEFVVNNSVLIPRFDTEVLVEEVLKAATSTTKLLDMCTGSGCIGLSVAAIKHCDVDLADISPAALKVAEDNRKRLGLNNIKIIDSDMFSNIDETYDIIVSNPPYIPTGDIDSLEPEVRNSEPVSALDGSKDGLKFYRILANKGAKYLKCGGSIFLEIGYNQAEDVKSLLENNKFADVRVIKDLAGLDRVVCGRRM